MASTKLAKPKVDHSAVTGAPSPAETHPLNAPPEGGEMVSGKDILNAPSQGGGGFMDSMKSALKGAGVAVPEDVNEADAARARDGEYGRTAEAPPAAPKGVLANIRKGRELAPPRILLVGTEGIGKSTFASEAPKPIFLQTEDGLKSIDCEKFPVAKSYAEFLSNLKAVANEPHDYQTVAVDSVDWLEKLIFENVCRRSNVSNIEKAGGGYAKGYTFALDEWREVVELLERCLARGMAIILIAHAKIERFEDPENPAYDRYSPRLHKHAQAFLTEWADAVLFAKHKLVVSKEGKGFDERAVAAPVGANGGERILRCVGSPACVAKNRYNLPAEMPLSWAAFADGLSKFMNQ